MITIKSIFVKKMNSDASQTVWCERKKLFKDTKGINYSILNAIIGRSQTFCRLQMSHSGNLAISSRLYGDGQCMYLM